MDAAKRRNLPYFLVLVVCVVTDWALTVDAIRVGLAEEGNPLMGWVFELPPWQSFIINVGFRTLALSCLLMLSFHRHVHKIFFWLTMISLALVAWHIAGRLFYA